MADLSPTPTRGYILDDYYDVYYDDDDYYSRNRYHSYLLFLLCFSSNYSYDDSYRPSMAAAEGFGVRPCSTAISMGDAWQHHRRRIHGGLPKVRGPFNRGYMAGQYLGSLRFRCHILAWKGKPCYGTTRMANCGPFQVPESSVVPCYGDPGRGSAAWSTTLSILTCLWSSKMQQI